jgi:hypothetical protein
VTFLPAQPATGGSMGRLFAPQPRLWQREGKHKLSQESSSGCSRVKALDSAKSEAAKASAARRTVPSRQPPN